MKGFPGRERREYVRALLWVDVEFTVMDRHEYEALMRSEPRPSGRVVSQPALSVDEARQYEADSTFRSNLIDFLIHMDDKLDRLLELVSKVSGPEALSRRHGKDEGFFVGQGSDISGAGMSVICDKVLKPGQILKTSFMISRFPLVPLVLFGEVLRVEPVEEDGRHRYQVVVKFIDLDEEDREKIIAYTFQVQRDAIRKERKGKERDNG